MRKDNSKSRILSTDKLHIESKTLFLDLKENAGGRFLQIAELSNARRSTIVIPLSGFEEFMASLQKIAEAGCLPEGTMTTEGGVAGGAVSEEF